jgi:hypothetical protein
MKTTFRTALVALAAVLVLAATTAASALATPQWRENGVRVTESKAATSTGDFQLEEPTSEKTAIRFNCTLVSKETIGAEGTGTITEANLTKCKVAKYGLCETSQPVTIKAINLPWKTDLYPAGASQVYQELWSGSKSTLPGWTWECTVVLGVKVTETCEGAVRGPLSNAEGLGVERILAGPEYQEPIPCKHGKADSTIQLVNSDFIKAASGANLSVTRE